MKKFLLLLILLPYISLAADLPTPFLTPGDVLTQDVSKICVKGYTKTVRNVSSALKKQVYKRYGLKGNHIGYCSGEEGCEVDHLISLELGGSNDIKNIWPQAYEGNWNAHMKDKLENKLHEMVCDGDITIEEAQEAISKDWIEAYRKYIGEDN